MLKRAFAIQIGCQAVANIGRLIEIPVLMLVLGLNEGGRWLLLLSVATISAISDGGLSQALSRSIQIRGNDEEATEVLWTGLFMSVVACLAVLPFLLLWSQFVFGFQKHEVIAVGALYLAGGVGLCQEFMNAWFQRFGRT